MKSKYWVMSCAIAALSMIVVRPAVASAQGREDQARAQEHTKFDDHDRQVVNTWYGQHKAAPPVGLRDRDRLSADVEAKFDVGLVLNTDLRSRVHTIPADLQHQLPAAPHDCRYVFIGGHLVLIDKQFTVRDIIHLH